MSDLTPGRTDLAVATVLAGGEPRPARVYVDLSKPFSTNRLAVPFDHCTPVPRLNAFVDAVDETDGSIATAEVVGINEKDRAIRIAIDWSTLRDLPA